MIGLGHVNAGGSVSRTVTENEQLCELFAASRAVHVTVVAPSGNTEPEAGTQATVSPVGQLSVTVGFEYITVAEHCPGRASATMFARQPIVGLVRSRTVQLNDV